jgi:predicted CXXCH cytochrome family protein
VPQGTNERRHPRSTAQHGAIAIMVLAGILQTAQARQIAQPVQSPETTWSDCAACHRLDPGLSHPVDMRPERSLPEWLPLDDRGRLTCTTCHEPVSPSHVEGGVTIEATLRAPAESLCTACHDPFAANRTDLHGSATGRAHLQRGHDVEEGLDFDRETAMCLSCHDGSVASDPGSEPGTGPPFISGHPIGVAYRNESSFRPLESVNPRIRLFDDRIGCGSCHSVFAGSRYLLTVSNQRSALCLSCHVQ